jgi:hypothetical protein
MSEEKNTNGCACRPCWQNCGVEADAEMLKIDAMEDSLSPLDEHIASIRWLITRFEACYHQADKEAERIAKAIGAGRCPRESKARPPKRKKELENTRRILSQWCQEPMVRGLSLRIGNVPADQLLNFIGPATPLKMWQVQRVVDRVTSPLDAGRPYHNLVLDVGDYGEPGATKAGKHYKDQAAFLEQTRATIIHDTVEDQESHISLGLAIDLLMPCHWDYVGALVIILKAIGGDLEPQHPFTCCSRNLHLSPLCNRLRTISNTLRTFWIGEAPSADTERRVLSLLGAPTPAKRWLAASLDKTIRLQLEHASDFWLKVMQLD